ncbi:hypothetical protein QRT07_09930 [Vibrio parahaemolyticus]|uniref:hypothetical protein n=1 Tax=Vibrio parahaemolyticus TaxID=670 RepID=UPI00257021B3|nr:hypothetical protein [Vibrio parahaemolyticus]WJE02895.1 hypothetical protein QRT07_09930 [Vibrio parahaemolyticus]
MKEDIIMNDILLKKMIKDFVNIQENVKATIQLIEICESDYSMCSWDEQKQEALCNIAMLQERLKEYKWKQEILKNKINWELENKNE